MRRENIKRENVKKEATQVRVNLNLRFVKGAGGFLVTTLSLKREAVKVESLKNKRRKYDLEAKKKVVQVAREHGGHEAARRVSNTPGYGQVDASMIHRWRKALEGAATKKKAGRKGTSDAFNAAVLSELVFVSIENVDNAKNLRVEANVAYSHAIIQAAAQRVKCKPLLLRFAIRR